jgi:hypothetical protein
MAKRLIDLMGWEAREAEQQWQVHKLECLARYVANLSRNDQIKWAEKQPDGLKEKIRSLIIGQKTRGKE